ncbi:MAG TPA: hydrogenase formation protein HypD [Deltaproteobacteria bacterium]|nr:hydrogenase formation protein HypD [Deltaproteobacteria bacterium]
MKYIEEFRDSSQVRRILDAIEALGFTEDVNLMEICGTHTHSISKYGIRGVMPSGVRLLSGPGCPVCVTTEEEIDAIVKFARENRDVVIATFGDMIKVPGSVGSLEGVRAEGADVRVVYSPLDALKIAIKETEKEVVFCAVGFETTAPAVGATVLKAIEQGVDNFSILSLHRLTPPAMRALMESSDVRIDGFICPGHVTTIIGSVAYRFLAEQYRTPCVVAGFEPLDALLGIYMLLKQIKEGRADIEVEYSRVVTADGNPKAKRILERLFKVVDADWRGFGLVPMSGLKLKEEFYLYDAEKRFYIRRVEPEDGSPECRCGDVLRGLITPEECPLFNTICTPESPRGPCMVSTEGTCAAYYRYERR